MRFRILWGALGGLAGVMAGHIGILLAHRWTGDANIWFKGSHGPPFFDLALSTSLYYACLGAGLGVGGRGWLRGLAAGFFSSFMIFVIPMAFSTHIFSWGEKPGDAATLAWFYLTLGSYIAMNAAAILVLGRYSRAPFSWRRAGGAASGAAAALVIQKALLTLIPWLSLGASLIIGYLAPWPTLLLGSLWGLLIASGVSLADRAPLKKAG